MYEQLSVPEIVTTPPGGGTQETEVATVAALAKEANAITKRREGYMRMTEIYQGGPTSVPFISKPF